MRGRDGTLISEIPIPKDTGVFVGVMSSNTNKALWGEDAYEWRPNRWLAPLPDAVLDAKIPGVYSNLYVWLFALELGLPRVWRRILIECGPDRMTFWGGGRACMCVTVFRCSRPFVAAADLCNS